MLYKVSDNSDILVTLTLPKTDSLFLLAKKQNPQHSFLSSAAVGHSH